MTPLTPPQDGLIGSKEEATAKAEEIVAAGGLAWVEGEYGNDMGHENVFWGYRVKFFAAERVPHDPVVESNPIMNEPFVQRVYVMLEAGWPSQSNVMALMDYETIPEEKHYRDEHELAAALRRLADRVEQGGSFVGPMRLTAESLRLARNEPDADHP